MPIFNVWVVRCKGAVAIRNNDWWYQMVTKALTLLGTISLRCSWYTCVDQIVLFKIQEYFFACDFFVQEDYIYVQEVEYFKEDDLSVNVTFLFQKIEYT